MTHEHRPGREYAKWVSWLRRQIRDDVYSMIGQRQVWIDFELLATVKGHRPQEPVVLLLGPGGIPREPRRLGSPCAVRT